MERMRWMTGEPYGPAVAGASARRSAAPAGFGLDIHGLGCAMADVKATAQRPLGLVGGNTG